MPRTARVAPGGMVFHCLNRGNDRRAIFADEGDYAAFVRVLAASLAAVPVRLLACCQMPNHWHLILWPRRDGELGRFVQHLTTTHVRRWHRHRHSDGRGHLYQGTYKSFPVQDDGHFLNVARYVERNALRARLVERAEEWPWGSLCWRERGSAEERGLLGEWPVARPADYLEWANAAQTDAEVAALRECVRRGRPFGDAAWQAAAARRLGLEATFRPRGRPRKAAGADTPGSMEG